MSTLPASRSAIPQVPALRTATDRPRGPATAAASRPGPTVDQGPRRKPRGWGLPLAVLIVGMFMSILDTSIVNVANPAIEADFGGSIKDIAWISTSYSLVLGVVVPASAWLGDRFGLGRVYLASLAAFALASALCGLAWNLDTLIAFRVIQAIPGGLIPAVTTTMVYRIVPAAKIGTAMGLYGLGIVFAPALGPALGGYLVEYVNWRLVFFINVPIGVLGLVAAVVALPEFKKVRTYPFDVVGFLAVAAGLVSLLLAFSEGESWGWTSYRVLGLMALGVLSLATFVVVELEVAHPLLDLRVFRHGAFALSLVVMSIMMTGLYATLFYIPLFLQQGLGYAAFHSGLLVLPQALVMALLTPIAGRLYDRIGPRYLAVAGLTLAAVGSYLLTGITADLTRPEVVVWMSVRSAGVGLAFVAVLTGGLSALPAHLTTSGSAFNTVAQRVTSAFGLAIVTALATLQQTRLFSARGDLMSGSHATGLSPGDLSAVLQRTQLEVLAQSYSDVFLLIAALTLVGAALSFMLPTGPRK